MKKKTQQDWVLEQLEKYGEVSRNNALSNFISRLGAIVCDLKAKGYEFTPEWRGNDYVYILGTKPKPPERKQFIVTDPLTGEPMTVY